MMKSLAEKNYKIERAKEIQAVIKMNETNVK